MVNYYYEHNQLFKTLKDDFNPFFQHTRITHETLHYVLKKVEHPRTKN